MIREITTVSKGYSFLEGPRWYRLRHRHRRFPDEPEHVGEVRGTHE